MALCIGAVLLFPAPGKSLPPEQIIEGVQDKYEKLNDMSAAFVQESRIATLGRSRSREGEIFFRKPGRMRWEYAAPDEQLLLSDGETFWFYSPGRKQVVIQKLDQAFTLRRPFFSSSATAISGRISGGTTPTFPSVKGRSITCDFVPSRRRPTWFHSQSK